MKNLWILLLVVLVAAGAFLLGRRSGPEPAGLPAPASAPADATAPAGARVEAANNKTKHGDASAPVRTFRGPDGLPQMITYDEKNPPDNYDSAQLREALLQDMRNHPENIKRAYGFSEADLDAMIAGSKPIPDILLHRTRPTEAK